MLNVIIKYLKYYQKIVISCQNLSMTTPLIYKCLQMHISKKWIINSFDFILRSIIRNSIFEKIVEDTNENLVKS